MNEFLFWCRHPLVPLLFHEVTSLHPHSFQRNDFSTCIIRESVLAKRARAPIIISSVSRPTAHALELRASFDDVRP